MGTSQPLSHLISANRDGWRGGGLQVDRLGMSDRPRPLTGSVGPDLGRLRGCLDNLQPRRNAGAPAGTLHSCCVGGRG